MNISIIQTDHLDSAKQKKVNELQHRCFPDVSSQEAELDFYHPEIAHVLAYEGKKLIGWAGIHISEVEYEDSGIILGGYGICVHPKFRSQGVASKMGRVAMSYLKNAGCDIGFLSVNPQEAISISLHKKFGFVPINTHFSWTNAEGKICMDTGAMIASINNSQLCIQILNSKKPLYVGNGYW
jgi:GNAT superfamily N-acetyltransferase